MATRTGTTHWDGDLATGSGTTTLASSNVASFPVNFPKRAAAEADGVTSPEELIGAAHAACYAMSLSHGLASAGTPATSLDVSADVTVDRLETGLSITSVVLTVTGSVEGIDADTFVAAAEAAKVGCPVSKALAGVPSITLNASLV